MMRRLLLAMTLSTALAAAPAQGQPALQPSPARIERQPDGFGGQRSVALGEVVNAGDRAYHNVRVTLSAYRADGELIGEGFGFLVDACGTALLDYALPPGRSHGYSAPFEQFGAGDIARLQTLIDADPIDYQAPAALEPPAVHPIASGEAVMLEWQDDATLLFGIGCDSHVFTELAWWRYSLPRQELSRSEHPRASRVTNAMIERSGAAMITQSGEQNPALYYDSRMTFAPNARRMVYQNDLHSILSAEADGSYARMIHDSLHQHSLRGFNWARQPGVFLAYYFGAYGEPVHYFSGNVDGALLMGRLERFEPSLTTPGPADDGLAAVVGWRADDVSGYYWQWAYGGSQLLFEAELPGNNYPAPVVAGDLVYVIRPIADVPTLQCFQRSTGDLHTITQLPMRLMRQSRAWAVMSPDGARLALAANGVEGGVWWVDLAGGCGQG